MTRSNQQPLKGRHRKDKNQNQAQSYPSNPSEQETEASTSSPIPKQWVLPPSTFAIYEQPQITVCRALTSYNWMRDPIPTIMVPGRPPIWFPPMTKKPSSQAVMREMNAYIRDADTANYTPYPLQPTVEAILHSNPGYNTRGVDVVACSLTMEHLLRLLFTRNAQPFRILVQCIGRTVFFLPRENNLNELVPGLKGYEATFPDWFTGWNKDVWGSESHHRVLEYEFGGLRCVMRFEADGYFESMMNDQENDCEGETVAENGQNAEDIDITDGPNGEEFTALSNYDADDSERMMIVHGGVDIPQTAIFDMEPRSVFHCEEGHCDINDHQKMARLWARQVHHSLVGYYQNGSFTQVQVQNVREKVRVWQRNEIDILGRLSTMLKKIVAFARDQDGQVFEVFHRSGWGLELQGVADVNPLLPKKLATRWTREPGVIALSDEEDQYVISESGSDESTYRTYRRDRPDAPYAERFQDFMSAYARKAFATF